jgi:phenylalanyl-tRNA synthetase beta chain
MLFSYNWLKEYIQGQFPSAEKLEELLNMHIFEVEEREQRKDDWLFDIALLAHRGDAASHYGLARDLAALLGRKMKHVAIKPLKKTAGSLAPLKVSVRSKAVYRYSAVVVQGVGIGKSPQWLQDRLELVGINSLNNVVDVTNYVMAELGQPLHAFDYDTLQEHQMTVREAKEGEKIETLDDLTFKLPQGTLVIEDKGRLIDLAGIKGGKYSAIGKNTKNVVFQSAVFSGERIFKTKKQLGYTTQAADLYARELDPNATMRALERALFLLGKVGGMKVVQVVDIYPEKRKERKLLFDPALLERYLGAPVLKTRAKQILQRLGFTIKEQKKAWEVMIPTFRQDVSIGQDLVEEIGRMQGYEKIAPIFPVATLIPSIENPSVRLKERVQDAFVEAGYTEMYNYSFIGEKDLQTFHYTLHDKKKLVHLQNPYSEEYKYLRPNLAENLLKALEENQRRIARKDIRVFEVGNVFEQAKGRIAQWNLATGVLGLAKKDDQAAFGEAKGLVDFMFSRLGVNDVWYDSFDQTPLHSRVSLWHGAKTAEIKVGDKKIGFLGIVAPEIAQSLRLKGSCSLVSLDIPALLAHVSQKSEYRPIPRFPAVYRDLALLVPRTTKVIDVMNVINAAGGELLDDVDLFDMYEGERVLEGQKNLAFHLIFQSPERTLTAREVDSVHEKIIKVLQQNPAWEIRT